MSFYFLSGHRPTLRYEDLRLTAPCSERLWEAKTFETWQQLKVVESKKRTTMRFKDYVDRAMDPMTRPSLSHFAEDEYLYGLCAMQAWLHRNVDHDSAWGSTGLPHSKSITSDAGTTASGTAHWVSCLNSWRMNYEKGKATGFTLSSDLHAHVVDMNAWPLYHLSQLELRSDLHTIVELSNHKNPLTGIRRRLLEMKMMEWSKTVDARWALCHAVQMLKLFGGGINKNDPRSFDGDEDTKPHLSLVSMIALYLAGLVTWAYTRSVELCKDCTVSSSLEAAFTDREPFNLMTNDVAHPLLHWIEKGGPVVIGQSIICGCRLGNVIEYYRAVLAQGNEDWPCSQTMMLSLSTLKEQR